MATLVFLEHHGGELQKGSLGVLAKAASLGDVDGRDRRRGREGARGRGREVRRGEGLGLRGRARSRSRCRSRASTCSRRSSRTAATTPSSSRNSVLAADVAAGLAARLDAGLNWDLVDVELQGRRARRQAPGAAGLRLRRRRLDEHAAARALPRRLVRRDARPAAASRRSSDVSPSYAAHSTAVKIVGQDAEESSGPSIEDADVIVAGGRGLGAPENFTLAEELAQALGGAVGATRAVVDAGWYPYSAQIGQTGKTVSPKLYVALGISGAIQHKVGMQSSGTIVAINKDANAPIFEFSDLGVVGDLHEIVPEADRARPRAARLMSEARRLPAAVLDARDFVARADRPGGRADRGRRPHRRRRPGRPRLRDPARPAARGEPGRWPSGSARCRSRVLEKGKQPGSHLLSGAVVNPRGAAPPLRRALPDGGPAVLRRGARRGRLRPHAPHRAADPAAAADAQPRQLDRLALAARPLPRRAGGGGRRDDPPRDRGAEAPRRARPRRRRPHRRQGPRPRGRRARQLRARLRPRREGHRARGGDAGPPHRRRARPLRPARRRAAGLGARREGGLEGREAARPHHPHDGLAAAHRQASTASSAARSSTRWARTWSRSASSSGSTTATPSSPSTTCCRS